MKLITWSTFAFLFLSMGVASAGISLPYGEKDGQVAFYNQVNHPDSEELNPWGPMSFRLDGTDFWVLDSVGSRILRVGADGKVLATIPVPKAENDILEDFALEKGKDGAIIAIYVLSAATQEIIKIAPDGKVLARFGGKGDASGNFLQFFRLEVGKSGRIYVVDKARQTLTVLSPEGKFVREVHWEWSGFALDPSENLCYLKWDEKARVNHLLIEDAEGKKVKEIVLQIGEHTNPDLWFVNAAGEAILAYIPPEGFKGNYGIARCGSDGKPIVVTQLKPPVVMNRYLEQTPSGEFFLGVANFGEAPKGSFKIESYTLK